MKTTYVLKSQAFGFDAYQCADEGDSESFWSGQFGLAFRAATPEALEEVGTRWGGSLYRVEEYPGHVEEHYAGIDYDERRKALIAVKERLAFFCRDALDEIADDDLTWAYAYMMKELGGE